MERLTPERLAEIRRVVQQDIPGGETRPRTLQGEFLYDLLAEIDALTRERDDALKIFSTERLARENARLAAEVAKLREAFEQIANAGGAAPSTGDWYKAQARAVLAETKPQDSP